MVFGVQDLSWVSARQSLTYVINEHLEETDLPPVLIITHLLERMRGDFTLMVLFAQYEVIIMAQCGYPLFFSDDDETIFFGSFLPTLAIFSPPMRVIDERGTILSCYTKESPFQPTS